MNDFTLATIILVVSVLGLKVYWDKGREQTDRREAYKRDLEYRLKQGRK